MRRCFVFLIFLSFSPPCHSGRLDEGRFLAGRSRVKLRTSSPLKRPPKSLPKKESLLEASRKGDIREVKEILEKGLDPNAKDEEGSSALHLALIGLHREVAIYLLKKGADPNLKDNEGWTPLHIASFHKNESMAKLLLKHGADPNAVDIYGRTPLHFVARHGVLKTVKLLFEYGARPDVKNKNGWSPLHLVSIRGHLEMAKLFLENGANKNIIGQGKTPLDMAYEMKMIEFFNSHGAKKGEELQDLLF